MNAPIESANIAQPVPALSPSLAGSERETAPANDDQICWIEVRQSPYTPDHQVELLHLQAEAEALLLQLQALQQRRA